MATLYEVHMDIERDGDRATWCGGVVTEALRNEFANCPEKEMPFLKAMGAMPPEGWRVVGVRYCIKH